MNWFFDTLSLLNRFQVACIIFVITLVVALSVKFSIYLYEKYGKKSIKKDIFEKLTKSPRYIVYGGIFLSFVAVIITVYKLWSEFS